MKGESNSIRGANSVSLEFCCSTFVISNFSVAIFAFVNKSGLSKTLKWSHQTLIVNLEASDSLIVQSSLHVTFTAIAAFPKISLSRLSSEDTILPLSPFDINQSRPALVNFQCDAALFLSVEGEMYGHLCLKHLLLLTVHFSLYKFSTTVNVPASLHLNKTEECLGFCRHR